MESRIYVCECCGYEVEAYEGMDTNAIEMNYCEDCFFEQYTYCDDCGEVTDRDESIYIENNDCVYCEHCADNNEDVFFCEYHQRWEETEYNYQLANCGGTICGDGMDDGYYFVCGDCEEVWDTDYACWSDRDEEYYCENCIDNHQNQFIKEYHEHEDDYEDNMRHTMDDEKLNTKLYFGMELEIESQCRCSNHDELAEAILNSSDDFVFENDGSLDDGFEIISMPFTKNYMKETLEATLKDMLKTIKNYGYYGADTCGLHFHISSEAVVNVVDLVALVEFFKEELTTLSRREESSLNRWSPFYTKGLEKEEITIRMIEEIVDDPYNRYHAINLDNYNTIEFRIFKSTTDYETLMATWELVNNIVNYVNDHEIDLNSMPSFYEVATYQENEFIESYMEKMGLLATC